MKKQMFALIAAAVLALPLAAQTTDDTSVKVQDFAVFVDLPTGFVFVKMPAGWKFVGKVEQETLAGLPANVITSLLPAEENESIARRGSSEMAKRPG